MRYREFANLNEAGTIGGTSASNIASVNQDLNTKKNKNKLGIGFDPDGDYGIYRKPDNLVKRNN